MDFQQLKKLFYQHVRTIVHIIVWIFVAAGYWSLRRGDWLLFDAYGKTFMALGFLLFPLVYYLFAFWLIPWFHARGKALVFAIISIFILVVLELNKQWIFATANGILGTDINFNYITGAYMNGPISLGHFAALGYAMIKYLNDYSQYVQRLKAEKNAMELAFLKSQMDPHFLFNTLNTLYGMALEEKSDKTADGIARLGTLMRYSLHDSLADFIPLGKEIDYINEYIELQRLRTTEKNRITVNYQINDGIRKKEKIAPMLLITLIENAFKYGISPSEETVIDILLKVENGELILVVKNSIINNFKHVESQGMGLQNLQNRLDLLYGYRHRLDVKRQEKWVYCRVDGGVGSRESCKVTKVVK